MPIGDFFGVLRRRWILVLVGVLMTVGLSGAAYLFFKPTYEITGTVLLLPPSSSSPTGSGNPYLRLGGLQQVVDLMGVSLSDQATQLELRAISKDVEFTVRADVRTSSPLLVIDVQDSSPETALQIRDILVARVPVRLGAMQEELNVGATDRVTSTVVTLDGQAEEVGKNRLRAAVVAGVAGLGLTLLVTALWDARQIREPRRRMRRRARPNVTQSAAPSAESTVVPTEDTAEDAAEDTVFDMAEDVAEDTPDETLVTPADDVSPPPRGPGATKMARMHWTSRATDDSLGTVAATKHSGATDAVTLLTVLIVVRLVLPSQFVIGPLGGAGAPATLFGLLLLAYWFWQRLHRVEPERAASASGVAIGFGAVVLASCAVAAARPINGEELSLSTLSLLVLAGWMGGLLLASDGVTSFERLRVMVSRLASIGGAFAGFGLVQFVTREAWIDKLSIPGLVANTPLYSIAQRDGYIRPFSTAIHPIEFGSVVGMVLPLTVVLGLLGSRGGRSRWRAWIPAALTVLAGSLSSSRSTMIGLAVGVILLWPALKPSHRVVGAVLTTVVGAFVFVTVPGMVGTISGLFGGVVAGDSSVASRVDSFAIASEYFDRFPLLGRGFGTFLPRYRIFDNQYLLGLVETGVLGLIAMVLLWVVPVVGIARVLNRSPAGSEARLLGTGLLSSCVVGGVELAFFDGFGFPMMPAIWFVVLGLGGAYVRLARATSA